MTKLMLPINAKRNEIKDIVNKIHKFLRAYIDNSSYLDSVGYAVYELIENVIKYSSSGTGYIRIDVCLPTIHISTINQATEEYYKILQEQLRGLNNPNRSEEEYMLRLLSSTSDIEPELSQMGLVRIAYESGASINASYKNGEIKINCAFQLEQHKQQSTKDLQPILQTI